MRIEYWLIFVRYICKNNSFSCVQLNSLSLSETYKKLQYGIRNYCHCRHHHYFYCYYYYRILWTIRPGVDQSSKAVFCKRAFAKSKLTFCKSSFARSRFVFRQSIFPSQKAMVWPSATSKMLSAKTCQNVLESIFAFC